MKQKRIITKDFFIGNLGDIKASDEIKKTYEKSLNVKVNELSNEDYSALVGDIDSPIEKIRKCYISWIRTDNNDVTSFISVGLRKIVENVNTMIWNIKLDGEWQSDIQFTKYIGKGDHYDWHKDYYEGEELNDGVTLRRISVVYCLSKKTDYSGGQFQIKTSNAGIYTTKFDYGDFIVFPSTTLHRVKPLSSGTRITMVGWYR
jgi:PKHD-type hydroxylase